MTAMVLSLTGASSASNQLSWDTLNWSQAKKEVNQLQMRIAKAVREGRHNKVKALQWLLTHSFYSKLLAVKRVTQNSGAKTPGCDGVVWRTPSQKMKAARSLQRRGYYPLPLRRIYIPKGKTKKGLRPLSIPSMKDRAMQALHLLSLEPVAEMRADKNAYGFRSKRSTADAIEQCFNALARKDAASWILNGDIAACFDTLSGQWLQDNIPMDKTLLTKWLTAGFIEKGILYPTGNGVPQGGLISPTILVLALSGLEEAIKNATSRKDKVHVISYADDFIITGASKEVLEEKVKPLVISFLEERGLELSLEKTFLTSINEGFDFLGFNIRKYKGKLLIKPSKKNISSFLVDIRDLIKAHISTKTEDLIHLLNPKIRGWSNYYRHVVAKATFNYVDHNIFQMIWKWINRKHSNKSMMWKKKKYFRSSDLKNWIFSVEIRDKEGIKAFLDLYNASQVPIKRHIKIKGEATSYDPRFREYFEERTRLKRDSLAINQKVFDFIFDSFKKPNRTTGSSHGL